MNFSSIVFLYYFLPCFFLFYFLVPDSFKNFILLLGSLFFYAWGEPRFVFFILLVITVDFFSALCIDRYRDNPKAAKSVLLFSLIFNIGLLVYFKYFSFFIENICRIVNIELPVPTIALPIGISFYTFQILSYIIDVYNKKVSVQRNSINLGTYIALFPYCLL